MSPSQTTFAERNDIIREMTQAATELSLADLSVTIGANRWSAPIICSKWNIDHEQRTQEERESAVALRAYGLVLARRLDEWANDMLVQTNVEATARDSANLLDLSDWLATSHGYGNLILASRCQDIAVVGLGRLVVDLAYPLGSVSSMVARLDAPWRLPDARSAVLNGDAGATLFAELPKDRDQAQRQREETWQNGELLRLQKGNPRAKAVFEGKNVSGFEAVSQMIAGRPAKPVETPVVLENLDFFGDDALSRQPRPWTTVSLWDSKQHRLPALGMDSANHRYLKALPTFRQYVKEFPQRIVTTPEQEAAAKAEREAAEEDGIRIVSFEASYSTPGAAAFAKAWGPYATSGTRTLDAAAWQAYSAITSGQFVDADTWERRMAAQTTAPSGHVSSPNGARLDKRQTRIP